MKLSTHNQPNDLRLNALVKQQTQEHQHLIAGHHREMQELRDSLKLAMERFVSISDRNEQDLKEFKTQTTNSLYLLTDRIMDHEVATEACRQKQIDLQKQLDELHDIYFTKSQSEHMKSQVQTQMTNASQTQTASLQDYQRATNALLASLKDEIAKLRAEMDLKIGQVSAIGQENFRVATLDKDGVLKELIRYKKEVFILEKKIENIYTLIGRTSEGGEI